MVLAVYKAEDERGSESDGREEEEGGVTGAKGVFEENKGRERCLVWGIRGEALLGQGWEKHVQAVTVRYRSACRMLSLSSVGG